MKDTTKKTKTFLELSLNDSELRYRRLFEAAQDGILILDADTGMIDDVNPYLIKMLGYSRDEFIKKKLWEAGAFKDIDASQEAFETLQEKEYIRYEDLPLKTKDGQFIQVEFVSNVYQVDDKKVIQCNIREITEHTHILAALQKNEKIYHDLINQSPDGFFVIASSGNILTVNKAICKALEYSQEELLHMNIWDIIPKIYLDQYRERLKKVLSGKSLSEEAEYTVQGKDGKAHYVEILSAPHYSGKDIIGFQGIARDITARKQAEEALHESEERFHAVLNSAPITIFATDARGVFTLHKGKAMSQVGMKPDENVGISAFELYRSLPIIESTGKVTTGEKVIQRVLSGEVVDGFTELKDVYFDNHFAPLLDKEGKVVGMVGVATDITERKRTEEALQASKLMIEKVINTIPVRVFWKDKNLVYLGCNSLFAHDKGFTDPKDIIGKDDYQMAPPDLAELIYADDRKILESGHAKLNAEETRTSPDGKTSTLLTNKMLLKGSNGDTVGVLGTYMDITERKQAEAALQVSESKFRSYIENAPLGLFVADQSGRYVEVNKVAHEMLGYTMSELLQLSILDVLAPQSLEAGLEMFQKVIQDGFASAEFLFRHKDGSQFWSTVLAVKLSEDRFMSYCQDITKRKLAEVALQESERRFRDMQENIDLIAVMLDRDGRVTFCNDYLLNLTGYSRESVLGQDWFELFVPPEADIKDVFMGAMQQGITPTHYENEILTSSGEHRLISWNNIILKDVEGHIIGTNSIGEDITERRRAEKALRESDNRFRVLIENSSDAITLLDAKGIAVYDSPAAPGMLGYGPTEWIGKDVFALIHPDDLPEIQNIFENLTNTPNERANSTFRVRHKSGAWLWVEMVATNLLAEPGVEAIVLNYRDISERKQTEKRIQQQLGHLTALSSIDRTIAASLDLEFNLSEILIHVMAELEVDAASILILNPSSKMLEYGAERGFRTKAIRKVQIRLGESYAGQVALERKFVQIPNLRDEPENLLLTSLLKDEDFACYYGFPLITKGLVKGVLQVFHRTPLEPDAGWLDFFQTLGGQAAIAIENASLFENLRRSNTELSLAYDATIEGWSHALDLRDKETEGHTQRVTEITVNFARKVGLSEDELVYVRWGALLHDIGKMGVPDGILLKPGPLTDEEWVKMKEHPRFAYELLAPIRYLSQALDIPYCHHEKWDGSGYPRGLKGTQIPLVARIFAVVDVWDALTSERPYRPAWTKEKTREHILSLSGTHFDPQVVDVFMNKMLDEVSGENK